ncbi:MAG: TadE family protein [Kiloniellales bacterium]
MRMRHQQRQRHRVDGRSDRRCAGAIAVELAMVAPMLILLFMGVWDFGRALYETARLASAARAGAHYGSQGPSYAQDTNGIVQAARDDAEDSTGALTVASTQLCQCPSGASVTCGGSCGAAGGPQTFIQVQVTESFSPLFPYPFVSNPKTLSRQTIWRVY